MYQLYDREVCAAGRCGLIVEEGERGTKRPAPDDECVQESVAVSKRVRDTGQPEPDMSRERRRQGAHEEHDFNLPLPWEGGIPCLVKVQPTYYAHIFNLAKPGI